MTPTTARFGGIAAVLTLAVSGCGLLDDSSVPRPRAIESVATPRDQLFEAVPDEESPAYTYDIEGGSTPASGVLDAARKTMVITMKESNADFSMTMSLLSIAERGWVKIVFKPANLPGLSRIPNKWLTVDPARLKDKKDMPVGYDGTTDPGDVGLLLLNAAAVTKTKEGHFTGTVDLTGSERIEIVDKAGLVKLGARAKAVPFEAVVDGAGHLTSMVVKIPAVPGAKASTYRVTYSGFGTTRIPTAPVGSQQAKATSTVYEMLNS